MANSVQREKSFLNQTSGRWNMKNMNFYWHLGYVLTLQLNKKLRFDIWVILPKCQYFNTFFLSYLGPILKIFSSGIVHICHRQHTDKVRSTWNPFSREILTLQNIMSHYEGQIVFVVHYKAFFSSFQFQ